VSFDEITTLLSFTDYWFISAPLHDFSWNQKKLRCLRIFQVVLEKVVDIDLYHNAAVFKKV